MKTTFLYVFLCFNLIFASALPKRFFLAAAVFESKINASHDP